MNGCDSRLVLRDIPIFSFIFGLAFAAFGGFSLYQDGPIIMLLFFGIGLAFLLFSSVLKVTADRVNRSLKLEYRSALLHSCKEFSFEEIAGIGVQTAIGSKGGRTYRVALKRKDGQLIPFRSSSSSGSKRKEQIAAKLRDFLGVPAFDSSAAGMAFAALSVYMDKLQESDGVHWQIQPVGSARWYSPDFKTPGIFLCLAQKAEGQASGGFLASIGSMIFKKLLSNHFRPEDTPGLDDAITFGPLDPALEPHFVAFSNAPDAARQLLNARVVALLADWAGRYPIRQFQKMSNYGLVKVLIGPGGVYLAPTELLQPHQVSELAALGSALVRSQLDRHA